MVDSQDNFQPEKFKVFVRYMIQVAKEKRCATYGELENVFGFSHKQVGLYAGKLGDYCADKRDVPPLNGLIISATDCVPSKGFDWYQEEYDASWGEIVSACWRKFHVTSTRDKQVQDFNQRDGDIENFLLEGS